MNLGPVLRSPLTHFALLGGLIFVLFAVLDDPPPVPPPDAITLTPQDASRLAATFEATWRRPPSPQELEGLMRNWALEEAHVREALALGLDRDDAVIRQRLFLKMQFVAESGAASISADTATLEAYLADNADDFAQPASFAFDQVLLPPGTDAAGVADLRTALAAGADPATLGVPTLLPPGLPLTPAPLIDRSFGTGFGAALGGLAVGQWDGPVASGYGQHLVRVTDATPPRLPPLDAIRPQVEAAWRSEMTLALRDSFGEALLGRYTVSLPTAAEVLGP
jgi:hypothetical protein